MSDLISRQAAIDALTLYIHNVDRVIGTNKLSMDGCRNAAKSVLDELPSAQLETHEERTETHACDLVDRRAAIEVIEAILPVNPKQNEYAQGMYHGVLMAKSYVDQLPSAQPDLSDYSDKLWRKAYERGKAEGQLEQRWISVSDRLPDEDHWLGGSSKQFSEQVLVTVVNHDDDNSWVDITETVDGEWVLELPSHCEIIAWRPLPTAYQGEGDE